MRIVFRDAIIADVMTGINKRGDKYGWLTILCGEEGGAAYIYRIYVSSEKVAFLTDYPSRAVMDVDALLTSSGGSGLFLSLA